MTQQSLFDWKRGDLRKIQGQKQVLDNSREEWKAKVLDCIHEIALSKKEFIFDDIRFLAIEKGIPKPHHPNAWGAIMRTGSTKGWMKKTGRCRPSTFISNNGTAQEIWESCL